MSKKLPFTYLLAYLFTYRL